MKANEYLHGLYNSLQEQKAKEENLTARYENGNLSKESFDSQMKGVNNTVGILDKQIDEEIKEQGLSEQDYSEARDEWQQQEQEQEKGR